MTNAMADGKLMVIPFPNQAQNINRITCISRYVFQSKAI